MCNESLHTKTLNGFTLNIYYDPDTESPLEWCNVKVAYRRDSRYTLGNFPVNSDEAEVLQERIESGEVWALPVYAYIHSGVALSTGPFGCQWDSCQWDSCQSGWIFVEKSDPDFQHYHGDLEQIHKHLVSELKDFSEWLQGSNYYFSITDKDGDVVESCGMGTWNDFDELTKECEAALELWATPSQKS